MQTLQPSIRWPKIRKIIKLEKKKGEKKEEKKKGITVTAEMLLFGSEVNNINTFTTD